MEIASFVIGVVGLAVGVIALFRWTIDLRRRAKWKNVVRGISRLDGQIRHYRFDVVIGLADGIVPAAVIALNYRIPALYFADATVSLRKGNLPLTPIDVGHVGDLTGKSILLVDNHIYTGTNMRAAVNALRAKHPQLIVTLALFRHQVSTAVFSPDLFVYRVHGRVRSVPWSLTPEHRSEYLS